MSYASAMASTLGKLSEQNFSSINVPISLINSAPVIVYSATLEAGTYSVAATITSIIASGYTPNASLSIQFGKQSYQILVNGVVKHQTTNLTPYDNLPQTFNLNGLISSSTTILLQVVGLPMTGLVTVNGAQTFVSNPNSYNVSTYNQGHNVSGLVSVLRIS
jgi:hypothetical protein